MKFIMSLILTMTLILGASFANAATLWNPAGTTVEKVVYSYENSTRTFNVQFKRGDGVLVWVGVSSTLPDAEINRILSVLLTCQASGKNIQAFLSSGKVVGIIAVNN